MSSIHNEDALAIFAEMDAMSRQNVADTEADRRGRTPPPWISAMLRILHCQQWGYAQNEVDPRFVLPVYDGDRPKDLSDGDIEIMDGISNEYRNRWSTEEGSALQRRDRHLDRGRGDGYAAGVRDTHRRVHEALLGETYDQRYRRIKESGGVISEARREETSEMCHWCMRKNT